MEWNEFVEAIAKFEGCPNVNGICTPYKDAGGIVTIGYGFTSKDFTTRTDLTINEALVKLSEKLSGYADDVKGITDRYGYNFNNNQIFALTSFAYNCGMGNLYKLLDLGSRNSDTIAQKIVLYNKCNGQVLSGLQKRRLWEQSLFLDNPTGVVDAIISCLRNSFCVNDIKRLQNTLNNRGANLKVDGICGDKTALAIKNYFN